MSRPLVNHKLHITLCVLTGTIWIFVYLPLIWLSKNPNYAAKVVQRRELRSSKKLKKRAIRQERQTKFANSARLGKSNLGYKPSRSKWATPYTLECNHLIRLQDWSGGKEGKMVFCTVCNSERRVVTSNPWNY